MSNLILTNDQLEAFKQLDHLGAEVNDINVRAAINAVKYFGNKNTNQPLSINTATNTPQSATPLVPINKSKKQIIKKLIKIYTFLKKDLLENDPVFKLYKFKNKDSTAGRLAELAFARMFPEAEWKNPLSNNSEPMDFILNSLTIDIKATETKSHNLIIAKEIVHNPKRLCDMYVLCYVSKSDIEYIVEVYGYITKEEIIKWKEETNPTPLTIGEDIKYKISKGLLTQYK